MGEPGGSYVEAVRSHLSDKLAFHDMTDFAGTSTSTSRGTRPLIRAPAASKDWKSDLGRE